MKYLLLTRYYQKIPADCPTKLRFLQFIRRKMLYIH